MRGAEVEALDEGTSWIQEDAETQGRTSADTEILLEQEEPTELVEDPVSTTTPKRQAYIRRSAEKRKDKGKAIMKDDESVQKKTKKDAEIAKQLQEVIDIARQEQKKYDLAQALELQKELDKRKEDVAETTQAYDIDLLYSDIMHNKTDLSLKLIDLDLIFNKRNMLKKKSYKKNDDSSKPSRGSRKKTLAKKRASEKQSEEGEKRQKMEDSTEKEELKAYLDIVPGEEFAVDVESLSTKYPIVD
ncbi:hypothetical protein Tco_0522483 [Tanacetum coccineum]